MKKYRAFKIEYLGANDIKPARIKITDIRFNQTVIVNYTTKGSPEGHNRAIEFLKDKGIEIVGETWAENNLSQHLYTILLTENFTARLK